MASRHKHARGKTQSPAKTQNKRGAGEGAAIALPAPFDLPEFTEDLGPITHIGAVPGLGVLVMTDGGGPMYRLTPAVAREWAAELDKWAAHSLEGGGP